MTKQMSAATDSVVRSARFQRRSAWGKAVNEGLSPACGRLSWRSTAVAKAAEAAR